MEFKGTKGKWVRYTTTCPSISESTKHSVYNGTNRISLCYDLFDKDTSLNVNEKEAEYNALLISKAQDLLNEINESITDLLCIQSNVYDACKTDKRWEGVYEILQKQIDRKKELIK